MLFLMILGIAFKLTLDKQWKVADDLKNCGIVFVFDQKATLSNQKISITQHNNNNNKT